MTRLVELGQGRKRRSCGSGPEVVDAGGGGGENGLEPGQEEVSGGGAAALRPDGAR